MKFQKYQFHIPKANMFFLKNEKKLLRQPLLKNQSPKVYELSPNGYRGDLT